MSTSTEDDTRKAIRQAIDSPVGKAIEYVMFPALEFIAKRIEPTMSSRSGKFLSFTYIFTISRWMRISARRKFYVALFNPCTQMNDEEMNQIFKEYLLKLDKKNLEWYERMELLT